MMHILEKFRKILQPLETYKLAKKIIPNEEIDVLDIYGNLIGIEFPKKEKDIRKFCSNVDTKTAEILKEASQVEKDLLNLLFYKVLSITISYERTGKIAFKVRNKFKDLLKITDFPEDVKLSQIVFPFNGFLIEIEDQIFEYDGYKADEGNIYVSVVDKGQVYRFSFNFIEKIIMEKDDLVVLWSIDFELGKDKTIKDFYKKIIEMNWMRSMESKDIGIKIGMDFNEEELDKTIINASEVIKENARILINLLLYINHINEDVMDISPIPKKLKEKLNYYKKQKENKKLEKLNKDLNRFPKVYLVGNKISESVEKEIRNTGTSKRPHWRRGHIRRYDPDKPRKRKFKKEWTFVKPTIVGIADNDELEGKNYVL